MRIPYTNFKTRTGDDNAIGGCAFIGGEWKDIDTVEMFDNKKIVLFALPGAFTPTCSSQQLPGYEELYDEIKAQGVDEVYCLSVNDAFVMNAWFTNQDIKKVKAVGDGEGVFTQGLGMLVSKPAQGFGMRSWRYSMLVENGEIIKQFVEEGQNDSSSDNDPFVISDAKNNVRILKNKCRVSGMVNHDPVMTNIEKTLMTYSKAKEHGWLEAKQSGGAVYELGVKQSTTRKSD